MPRRSRNGLTRNQNRLLRAVADGVTLYADVCRPDAPGQFPVLLARTPYGKDAATTSPNGSSQFFARFGYVTVMQDCRGRVASEGDYEPIFQEVADGYDAVEWAARLPWAQRSWMRCE